MPNALTRRLEEFLPLTSDDRACLDELSNQPSRVIPARRDLLREGDSPKAIYLILEGEGYMELDGERIPVKPMTSIFIKPGCRHRAVGKMKIINIPIPAFDPADEWFDEDAPGHGSR